MKSKSEAEFLGWLVALLRRQSDELTLVRSFEEYRARIIEYMNYYMGSIEGRLSVLPGEKGIVSLEETIRDKLETKRDNKGRMETK